MVGSTVGDRRTSVLLVDDEADMRLLVRELIRRWGDGLEVVGEAADGREALRLWKVLAPDIVVLDVRMPGWDGLTVARQILDGRPDQDLVLLSGCLEADVVREAQALGFRLWLSKDRVTELPEALARLGL